MFKHILIPTDGSDVSKEAAKAGVKLAKALGARVTGFFAAPAPTPVVYVVASGDTLSSIAARFGVTLDALIEANRETIPNPDRLAIGDQLIIPVAPAAPTSPVGSEAPAGSTTP